MKKPEVLAIIPARGGSKGIPRKNIRPFAGHPLIAYSIAAALQAGSVSRVIVTTDDKEIGAIARQYKAETPFLRPNELAGDDTLDLPVFKHALTWLAENENYHPDLVVHLRPTTPLRPPDLVDNAVHLLWTHPEARFGTRNYSSSPKPVQDVADGQSRQTHSPAGYLTRYRRAV